jgi:uncharacterized protein
VSPIWYACANNQKEIVALFLDNGLDVNHSRPLSGETSSMNSYLDWVETATSLSIQSSFTLNTTYEYGGESLLHLAVKSGHISMIKLLIERGASVNIQDESGNTALHYAAANGKKDAVKFLLEKSADPSIVNTKEQKAIDYANIKGFNEITALILNASTNGGGAPTKSDQTTTHAPFNKKQALLDLKELLDSGVLSQNEFDAEKSKILKG